MNRMLFSSLVVAVSLGACADKKPGAPAPVAPGLSNIDGAWKILDVSCGKHVLDLGPEDKSSGIQEAAIVDNEFRTVSRFAHTEKKEIPEEVKEDGTIVSKKTARITTLEVLRTVYKIGDRTEKTMKWIDVGSKSEVWQSEDGKEAVRLETTEIPPTEKDMELSYVLQGDELLMTRTLSDKELIEDGNSCVGDDGTVYGREEVIRLKRDTK